MARQGDPFHSSLDSDLDGAVDSLFEHQSSADKERKARLVPLRAVCRALRQAARYIQHRPYASVARLARRGSLWAPLPRAAEEAAREPGHPARTRRAPGPPARAQQRVLSPESAANTTSFQLSPRGGIVRHD